MLWCIAVTILVCVCMVCVCVCVCMCVCVCYFMCLEWGSKLNLIESSLDKLDAVKVVAAEGTTAKLWSDVSVFGKLLPSGGCQIKFSFQFLYWILKLSLPLLLFVSSLDLRVLNAEGH